MNSSQLLASGRSEVELRTPQPTTRLSLAAASAALPADLPTRQQLRRVHFLRRLDPRAEAYADAARSRARRKKRTTDTSTSASETETPTSASRRGHDRRTSLETDYDPVWGSLVKPTLNRPELETTTATGPSDTARRRQGGRHRGSSTTGSAGNVPREYRHCGRVLGPA